MKESTKQYFTIPNLMGYFRILVLPIYIWFFVIAFGYELAGDSRATTWYLISAGVIAVSAITDFFDGKVARHFNQITDFGKILDPFADKLTQGIIAITMTIRYFSNYRIGMTILLSIFVVKEFAMGITGLVLMRKGWKTGGAIFPGKISTWCLDLSLIAMLLIPQINGIFLMGIVCLCIFFMCFSIVAYVELYFFVFKELKANIAPVDIDTNEIYKMMKQYNRAFIKNKVRKGQPDYKTTEQLMDEVISSTMSRLEKEEKDDN